MSCVLPKLYAWGGGGGDSYFINKVSKMFILLKRVHYFILENGSFIITGLHAGFAFRSEILKPAMDHDIL